MIKSLTAKSRNKALLHHNSDYPAHETEILPAENVASKTHDTAEKADWTLHELRPRIGDFVVSPISAEGFQTSKLHKLDRLCIVAHLLPYDQRASTKSCAAAKPEWNASLKLHHTAVSVTPSLRLEVQNDTPLGARSILGHADVDLRKNLEKAGVALEETYTIRNQNELIGKVKVSIAFHPKLELQHDLTAKKRSQTGAVAQNLKDESKDMTPEEVRKRTERGKVSIQMKGVHICDDTCTKVDGHALLSFPDFTPTVRVIFEDNEEDLATTSEECSSLAYKAEWPAHSVHSTFQIEILRKASLTVLSPRGHRTLESGRPAACIGAVSISLFEIKERAADAFVREKFESVEGPGKESPPEGFAWYVLRHGSDEIGLVCLKLSYTEYFFPLLDDFPHPDADHLDSDEAQFDHAIFKRNLDRLDDILSAFQFINETATHIFEWKSPPQTLFAWGSVIALIAYFPTAHFPAVVFGVLILRMLWQAPRRWNGHYRRQVIEHNPDAKRGIFRPLATLKICPIEAKSLPTDERSGTNRLDPFVRMYYEPLFNDQPAHVIAQTEAIHETSNPVWGGQSHEKEKTAAIARMHNIWFKNLVNHLSTYEQDAVIQDMVEAWPREDGGVDSHSYKYPILQPIEKIGGIDELVPWERAPGMVRFDVVNAGPFATQNEVLGQIRVPLKSLVKPKGETKGGPQLDVEKTFCLRQPSESILAFTEAEDAAQPVGLSKDLGTLRVRMQLTLREPGVPITLQEKLAQDAMYNITELQHSKSLSLMEKFNQVKTVAKNIQNTIGAICTAIERFGSLLSWSDPVKSLKVGLVFCVVFFLAWKVPVKYILMFLWTKRVTKKFHQLPDTDAIRLGNLLSSFPSQVDMSKVFQYQNKAFLESLKHAQTQAKLQAEWAGAVWKRGEGIFGTWQSRYAVIRNSRLEYWHTRHDAKSGIPPKSHIVLSNVVEDCNDHDKKRLPKDSYGVAIYDIEKIRSHDSPQGHRRLVALKSESDYKEFVEIVRKCGETLSH